MRSVVLNTITDITLLLHMHDPAGCTKHAPLDEYAHEAAMIFVQLMEALYSNSLLEKETVRTIVLANICKEVFEKQFDDCLLSNDANVWTQIAEGVWNVYFGNIERHSHIRKANL